MSKFIIGSDRSQIPLFASSLEQAIAQDNEVRLIDLFVESLNLADYGFKSNFVHDVAVNINKENIRIYFLYNLLIIAVIIKS